MDLKIAGKKALMAGGSAGMGRATAERLAEAGVELYISARREERLLNAAKEITEKYGNTVTPIVADSSTEEGRATLFSACPDPDILIRTGGFKRLSDFLIYQINTGLNSNFL